MTFTTIYSGGGRESFGRKLKLALIAPIGSGYAHSSKRTPILSRWCWCRRTSDLDHAPGPCTDREPEVVQLYNRGDEVQAETQA
jgi:hypothetical protein